MKFKKPSSSKKILIIIFSIIIIVSIFSVNFFASKYLENAIEAFNLKSDNPGSLHIESLRVNVFTGNAFVKRIHYKSSPVISDDTVQNVALDAELLEISGISFYSLVYKKILKIKKISLIHPQLIIKNLKSTVDDSLPKDNVSFYDYIGSPIISFHTNEFVVTDGSLYVANQDSVNFRLTAQSVNLKLDNLNSDIGTRLTSKAFEIGDVDFSGEKIDIRKGLYQFVIPNIHLNTKDLNLAVDSAFLIPIVDQVQLASRFGYRSDYIKMTLAEIKIQSHQFKDFLKEGNLFIDSTKIGYAKVHFFNNKNIPDKAELHLLPQAFLDSLDYKIAINLFELKNGTLEYEELEPENIQTGAISFNKIHAVLTGLSNVVHTDTMKLAVTGFIQSEAAIKVNIIFPRMESEYNLTADVGPFNMKILNSMIKSAASFQIESGKAESATLYFNANEKEGNGAIKFLYTDLKIQSLDSRMKEPGGILNSVKSYLANKLIIVKDNPDNNNVLRVGNIQYARNPQKNLVNYIWKLVYSGLKSSVGVDQEKLTRRLDHQSNH